MLESALLYLWWRTWKYTGQRRKLVFSTTPSRQKASLSVCFVILSTIDFGLGGAEDRSRHHHKTNVFFSEHESVFFCTSFYLHFLLHCVFRIGMNVAQKWGEKATQWDSPIKIILLSPPKTLGMPLPYETTESSWSTRERFVIFLHITIAQHGSISWLWIPKPRSPLYILTPINGLSM